MPQISLRFDLARMGDATAPTFTAATGTKSVLRGTHHCYSRAMFRTVVSLLQRLGTLDYTVPSVSWCQLPLPMRNTKLGHITVPQPRTLGATRICSPPISKARTCARQQRLDVFQILLRQQIQLVATLESYGIQ
jgi:hypothetical protein